MLDTLESVQPVDIGARLAQSTDLNEQWAIIHGTQIGDAAESRSVSESCQLLDFAANPECSSRYLRAYALECGYRGVLRASEAGRAIPEQYQAAVASISSILPAAYVSSDVRTMLTWQHAADGMMASDLPDGVDPGSYYMSYHKFFIRQAGKEGIETNNVAPSMPGELVCDAIPVAAGMFLQDVAALGPRQLDALSPAMADEALDLFLNFQAPDFHDKVAVFRETAKLARYTRDAGIEHDAPVEFLHRLPQAERLEYAEVLNRLHGATAKLSDFFPPELADGVVKGQRILIANALFALADHIENGMETNSSLQLLRLGEIPVRFSGDQPIRLLEKFASKIERAHKRLMSPTTERRVAVAAEDFSIIDFVDPQDDDPLMMMLYVRPEPSKNCEYRYEYGSRRLGVEASIDWRFDEGTLDPTRPYHKGSRTKEAFSLRTDREGRAPDDVTAKRDPLSEIGTVSFDSGSVLSEGFGGDFARLLAHGNRLRGHRHLNHMPDSIDQRYGNRTSFARVARTMLHQLVTT
jgi:hypothetical protein